MVHIKEVSAMVALLVLELFLGLVWFGGFLVGRVSKKEAE
jgi:hypothetical protein